MAPPTDSPPIHLTFCNAPESTGPRRCEPITTGVPFARGHLADVDRLRLIGPDGLQRPLQARATDRWSDGSIRWALIDFQADVTSPADPPHLLFTDGASEARAASSVVLTETTSGVEITTGPMRVTVAPGGAFPISSAAGSAGAILAGDQSGFEITSAGRRVRWVVAEVSVVDAGPVRAELLVRAVAQHADPDSPLSVFARLEVFAGSPVVRVSLTIRNTRPAAHPGGQWPLGDPGSFYLDSAALVLHLTTPLESLSGAMETGQSLRPLRLPFRVLQASSGTPRWNAATHLNKDGRVTLPFRGYRATSPDGTVTGDHALPIVTGWTGAGRLTVTVPHFWQRFPSAVSVEPERLTVGLLPEGVEDVHELQGGEQTTGVIVMAFGDDEVSDPPLAWCHSRLLARTPPAYVSATNAVPYLPADDSAHQAYFDLVRTGLVPALGFVAKRDTADEYGWRHYGDIPADHESAFRPPDQPFVSHYNNQYDAIAGFACHFLRSGTVAWWSLMDDLARHVRDIDIYHTSGDKSAYNHGLFWHTNHYVDAGTSTHRTYPRGNAAGGGPSAEHNYNQGLMLHYFLTGDPASREAAVGLGQWTIDMDDGSLTPFRWLSRAPTGLASFTFNHHQPGRGAGHSIMACIAAHRLTGERKYLDKAESLIARCVHPDEAIAMTYVENIETHWSYTAFLQALGLYLEHKIDLGDRDAAFGHGRQSLLVFARWMVEHEHPYLDRRDLLEYPTETWVAQDLRKADVFFWAARHAAGAERLLFSERSRLYLDYVTGTIPTMAGYWFARPLVLILTQGLRAVWLCDPDTSLPPAVAADVALKPAPPRPPFTPQRRIALRRAVAAAIVGATGALTLTGWIVWQWL